MFNRRNSLVCCGCVAAVAGFLSGCGSGSMPAPIGAEALSNHYVRVEFAQPAAAVVPADFTIQIPQGGTLAIHAAWLNEDGLSAILTTDSQQETEYELSTSGSETRMAFGGSTSPEPFLHSAVSLDDTHILLRFSEAMAAGAQDTPFDLNCTSELDCRTTYALTPTDVKILGAVNGEDAPELDNDGTDEMAVLTTSSQQDADYTVKVTNLESQSGNKLIDPSRNTATLRGIPAVDTAGPALIEGVTTSDTTILLSFDEPLDDGSDDPTNFSIDPALAIIDATLTVANTQILLTTLPQTAGVAYTVTVEGVVDRAGNLIDANANSIAVTFPGSPSIAGGNVLPRLVGAASVDNTHVVVTFSKSMSDSVANPANYVIVQENVNPEVGALSVVEAAFLGQDKTAVQLTTYPQNEVTYLVTAVNVLDQQGNQLAPKTLLADPRSATFPGTPPSGSAVDTDGDGVPDREEQRGWVVFVVLGNGEIQQREVTSDPMVADTDGDGLDDSGEKWRSSDPRDPDTDDDELPDPLETSLILSSSPTNQDTDGDGIVDTLEAQIYRTALYLADTDGDGFDDRREILELNKNPRVADLPKLDIDIGDMMLRIDERFIDQTTEAEVLSSSTSTSLSRSEQTQFSESDTTSLQGFVSATLAGYFKVSKTGQEIGGSASGTASFTYGHVSQVSEQSSRAAQQDYQNSLSKSQEFQTSVTRQVYGASVDSNLTIENLSDVAFTLENLEISALLPSRQRDRFVPIASLVPSSELLTGDPAVYNLGPFEQKGPIVVSNQEVFPNLVEDLMRNPRGLIFEVANYDITDEFERNIAFQQQEVLGRTVQLTVDPGDGSFERLSVAVNGAFTKMCDEDSGNPGESCEADADCRDGACTEVFLGGFDEAGRLNPLPMDYVLQEILHFERNRTEPDAIVAGPNGIADTVAVGDDEQVVPFGTTGLNDRTIVIRAGANGVLNTSVEVDDAEAVTTGYATSPTCNEDTDSRIVEPQDNGDALANTEAIGDDVQEIDVGSPAGPGEVVVSAGVNGRLETVPSGDDEFRGPGEPCFGDDDRCPDGACDAREVLVRFGNSITGDPNRFWVVIYSEEICNQPPDQCDTGIPAGSNFDDIPLRPSEAVTLAFGQDIDRDGLFAREEFVFGSSDRSKDTDEDTLGDFAEIRIGWQVTVQGRPPETVYPDPRLADSEFDGLSDPEEQQCLLDPTKRDTDGDGIPDMIEIGLSRDLDGDGLIEYPETGLGRCCFGPDNCPTNPVVVPCRQDTDCPAPYTVCEPYSDLDDLSEICPPDGMYAPQVPPVRLDPRNPDTDGDFLPDGLEFELLLNPLNPEDASDFRDIDQDGLTDVEELMGWEVEVSLCSNTCALAFNGFCDDSCDDGTDCADCGPVTQMRQVYPNPTEGDSDFDGLPDLVEATILSDPLKIDTDGDGLLDFDEFDQFGAFLSFNVQYPGFNLVAGDSQMIGTSLNEQDTDGDLLNDQFETVQGWRVLFPGEGALQRFSHPLFEDSDLDGLIDREEYTGADGIPQGADMDSGDATDPSNPDTDGDTRPDGLDISRCSGNGPLCTDDCDCSVFICNGGPNFLDSCENDADCPGSTCLEICPPDICLGPNPLVPDIGVRVNLISIDQLCGLPDGANDYSEVSLQIRVNRPLQGEHTTLLDQLLLHELFHNGENDQWLFGLWTSGDTCLAFDENDPVCGYIDEDGTVWATDFYFQPPTDPEREFCMQPEIGWWTLSQNINCENPGIPGFPGPPEIAPVMLDNVETTFSVPLGDPFNIEVSFVELDGCVGDPPDTPITDCAMYGVNEHDTAQLLGQPHQVVVMELEDINNEDCTLRLIYEIEKAPFSPALASSEVYGCSNLLDDDGDGDVDCQDSDCDQGQTACEAGAAECADMTDNDNDGSIDCLDVGCSLAESCETGGDECGNTYACVQTTSCVAGACVNLACFSDASCASGSCINSDGIPCRHCEGGLNADQACVNDAGCPPCPPDDPECTDPDPSPECVTDDDCACACDEEADCPEIEVCIGLGCTSDANCPQGESCLDADGDACDPGDDCSCSGLACTTDLGCPAGSSCVDLNGAACDAGDDCKCTCIAGECPDYDDDGDGLINCADPGCALAGPCTGGD